MRGHRGLTPEGKVVQKLIHPSVEDTELNLIWIHEYSWGPSGHTNIIVINVRPTLNDQLNDFHSFKILIRTSFKVNLPNEY